MVIHGAMNVTKSAVAQHHNNNSNNNTAPTNRGRKMKSFGDFFDTSIPHHRQEDDRRSENATHDEHDSDTDIGIHDHEEERKAFNLDWSLLKKPSPGSLPPSSSPLGQRGQGRVPLPASRIDTAPVSVQKELERYSERLAQQLESAFLSEVERDAEMDLIFDNALVNNNFNLNINKEREERLGLVRLYASGSGAEKLLAKEKSIRAHRIKTVSP